MQFGFFLGGGGGVLSRTCFVKFIFFLGFRFWFVFCLAVRIYDVYVFSLFERKLNTTRTPRFPLCTCFGLFIFWFPPLCCYCPFWRGFCGSTCFSTLTRDVVFLSSYSCSGRRDFKCCCANGPYLVGGALLHGSPSYTRHTHVFSPGFFSLPLLCPLSLSFPPLFSFFLGTSQSNILGNSFLECLYSVDVFLCHFLCFVLLYGVVPSEIVKTSLLVLGLRFAKCYMNELLGLGVCVRLLFLVFFCQCFCFTMCGFVLPKLVCKCLFLLGLGFGRTCPGTIFWSLAFVLGRCIFGVVLPRFLHNCVVLFLPQKVVLQRFFLS